MNEEIMDQFMDNIKAFADKNKLDFQETCRLLVCFSLSLVLANSDYDIVKARKHITGIFDSFEEMFKSTKVLHD